MFPGENFTHHYPLRWANMVVSNFMTPNYWTPAVLQVSLFNIIIDGKGKCVVKWEAEAVRDSGAGQALETEAALVA